MNEEDHRIRKEEGKLQLDFFCRMGIINKVELPVVRGTDDVEGGACWI